MFTLDQLAIKLNAGYTTLMHKATMWWKGLFTKRVLLTDLGEVHPVALILRWSIKDVNNIDYETIANTLMYYNGDWNIYPEHLLLAGSITAQSSEIDLETERLRTLSVASGYTNTEVTQWRKEYEGELFLWLCDGKYNWDYYKIINSLNNYAEAIGWLASKMRTVKAQGPLSTVQKNNWRSIDQELHTAVNTMLHLLVKLDNK